MDLDFRQIYGGRLSILAELATRELGWSSDEHARALRVLVDALIDSGRLVH